MLGPSQQLRQQIGAEREDKHHDQGGDNGAALGRHDDCKEGAQGRRAQRACSLRQLRIKPRQRRIEHQHGIGKGKVAQPHHQCREPGRPACWLVHQAERHEQV